MSKSMSEYMMYNYVTGEHESPQWDDDDRMVQYLDARDGASWGMYRAYRKLGLEPWQALVNVLHRQLGEPAPFDPATRDGG